MYKMRNTYTVTDTNINTFTRAFRIKENKVNQKLFDFDSI